MIRRAGSSYKHVHEGVVLGTHKRKADAELQHNALRLGVTPARVEAARKAKK